MNSLIDNQIINTRVPIQENLTYYSIYYCAVKEYKLYIWLPNSIV